MRAHSIPGPLASWPRRLLSITCNFTVRADFPEARIQRFVDTLPPRHVVSGSKGVGSHGTRRTQAVAARVHKRIRATRKSSAEVPFLQLSCLHRRELRTQFLPELYDAQFRTNTAT